MERIGKWRFSSNQPEGPGLCKDGKSVALCRKVVGSVDDVLQCWLGPVDLCRLIIDFPENSFGGIECDIQGGWWSTRRWDRQVVVRDYGCFDTSCTKLGALRVWFTDLCTDVSENTASGIVGCGLTIWCITLSTPCLNTEPVATSGLIGVNDDVESLACEM